MYTHHIKESEPSTVENGWYPRWKAGDLVEIIGDRDHWGRIKVKTRDSDRHVWTRYFYENQIAPNVED